MEKASRPQRPRKNKLAIVRCKCDGIFAWPLRPSAPHHGSCLFCKIFVSTPFVALKILSLEVNERFRYQLYAGGKIWSAPRWRGTILVFERTVGAGTISKSNTFNQMNLIEFMVADSILSGWFLLKIRCKCMNLGIILF